MKKSLTLSFPEFIILFFLDLLNTLVILVLELQSHV